MPRGPSGRERVDRLLVRWCQQSAPGEETVATRQPLHIDPRLAAELGRLGNALDRLLRRWANGILAGDVQLADFRLPAFPLAKEFFAAGPLRAPFFWGRFDIFERVDGGLAVLEYNCDKPAGQREIWAAEAMSPSTGNINRGALAHFRLALGCGRARQSRCRSRQTGRVWAAGGRGAPAVPGRVPARAPGGARTLDGNRRGSPAVAQRPAS